ncbi:hypothetical protein ACA910_022090 [Epithemia clementina (nom. ined.)]
MGNPYKIIIQPTSGSHYKATPTSGSVSYTAIAVGLVTQTSGTPSSLAAAVDKANQEGVMTLLTPVLLTQEASPAKLGTQVTFWLNPNDMQEDLTGQSGRKRPAINESVPIASQSESNGPPKPIPNATCPSVTTDTASLKDDINNGDAESMEDHSLSPRA